MADTKIKFQAEGLDSIHKDLVTLVEDAKSLSSVFESSGEKVLGNLKQQIDLLNERNSLLRQGANIGFVGGQNQTPLNTDDLEFPLRDLTSKFDVLIELLSTRGLNLSDSTIEQLRGSASRGSSGAAGTSREPETDTQKFWKNYVKSSIFSALNTGFSSWSDAIQAENPYLYSQQRMKSIGSTIAGITGPLAALGPYGILAALAGTTIGGFMNLGATENMEGYKQLVSSERSRSRMVRLQGGKSPYDYLDYARDLGGYLFGYKNEEALSLSANSIVANGGRLDKKTLFNLLGASRAFDISSAELDSLIRSQRGSGLGAVETLGSLFGGLRSAGLSEDQTNVQIAEYLRVLVGLNQSQLDTLGKLNQEGNIDLIMRLTNVTGPGQSQRVNRLANTFDQSISNPSTPQLRAMIYQAIKGVNPSASYLDVRRIQDEGLAANPEVAKSLMETISKVSGGNYDQTILNLQGFLGGKIQDVETLYDAYLGKGRTLTKSIANLTSEQISKKGMTSVSNIQMADAATEQAKIYQYTQGLMAKMDEALADSIKKADLLSTFNQFKSDVESLSIAIRKVTQKVSVEKLSDDINSNFYSSFGGMAFK